jgi:hypothetical protein
MIRWIPYLRSLVHSLPGAGLVAGGYANDFPLYRDLVSEYWVVPEDVRSPLHNQEQMLNDGVFHGIAGNDGYERDARRKRLPSHASLHRAIARGWFAEVRSRQLDVARIVCALGQSRAHRRLEPAPDASMLADRILQSAGIGPSELVVLVLPRLRAVQRETRTWSPRCYLAAVRVLRDAGLPVVVLGTRGHEWELAGVDLGERVVNSIGLSFELQLAFWERAAVATGPPCGGLVAGYLMGVPLVHWYKPGAFPCRHGVRWDEGAEADYSVFGVRASWVEVGDDAGDDTGPAAVLDAVIAATMPSREGIEARPCEVP